MPITKTTKAKYPARKRETLVGRLARFERQLAATRKHLARTMAKEARQMERVERTRARLTQQAG